MRILLTAAALTGLFLSSSAASAQGAAPGAPQVSPETMAKIQEFREVQQKLDALRAKALQNDTLAKKQEKLEDTIETAMKKANPQAAKDLERFDKAKGAFEKARATGDMEKARSLAGELQQLSMSLRDAQAEAMKNAKVASAVESFSDDLFAAMVKIDPKAKQLQTRAETLVQELRAAAPQKSMPMPSGG